MKIILLIVLLFFLVSCGVAMCSGDKQDANWCEKTDQFFSQNPYAYQNDTKLADAYNLQCAGR